MKSLRRITRNAVATVIALLAIPSAWAAPLLEEFHVIGVGATPYSQPIDLAQTGDYSLLLTDREFPAPLDFVAAGVVRGASLVGAQSGAGTATFRADAGSQTLYVVGTPAAQGSGSFGVEISPAGGNPVVSSVGTLQAPSASAAALALDLPFSVTTPATYTLTLTDREFPAALSTFEATVIRLADQATVATLGAAGTADFDADAGDYELFIVGDAASGFGLLSYELRSAALGLTVFAESAVVDRGADGSRLIQSSMSPGAGDARLTLTDFEFPARLAGLSARIVHDADVVGSLDGAGSIDFVAAAGEHSLLVYAQADAEIGSGTFGASVEGSSGTALETVDVVSFDAPDDAAPATELGFDIASAGSYALTLTDFEFPLAFGSMQLALLRGSQVVDTLNGAGTLDFDATPGSYSVAVVAEPTATDGAGLLGIRVTHEPDGALVFEDTHPFGTLFASSTLRVATAEDLDLVLTDAAFPARFLSLSLALTQGTQLVGFVFGGGTLSFDAMPGDYAINVLASPDQTLETGAYGLTVEPTPAPPPPPPPPDDDDDDGGSDGGGGGGGGASSPLWLAVMACAWGARRLRASKHCGSRAH